MSQVGDPIKTTPLEADYQRYAAFCKVRDAKPATFRDWINAQHKGWRYNHQLTGSGKAQNSERERQQADERATREHLDVATSDSGTHPLSSRLCFEPRQVV